MNTDQKILDEVLHDLYRMLVILQCEGGSSWTNGLQAAIDVGSAEADCKLALWKIGSIIKTMYGGPGGFGDFFIWRDDFEDRVNANVEFKALSDRLWINLNRNNK